MPVQMPVGVEADFCGVVDLIEGKVITYCGEDHTDTCFDQEFNTSIIAA